MTVNTNGNKVEYDPIMAIAQSPHAHSGCCGACTDQMTRMIASQLRTEAMVKDFIDNIGKNPMFKMMAGKFGG